MLFIKIEFKFFTFSGFWILLGKFLLPALHVGVLGLVVHAKLLVLLVGLN